MPSRTRPAIVVHGGAGGRLYKPNLPLYKKELGEALLLGSAALSSGSSIEAVEAAVRYMEDCGAFNAGRGSVLTKSGEMQLDAAVMIGRGLRAGAVGACTCTNNPVALARFVMEKTNASLVVGEYCRPLAAEAGMVIESLRPLSGTRERHAKLKSGGPKGTVGAVAIDSRGTPSAAVSTGGLWMKLPGRVGDSAIIGAGVYADDRSGAACATGVGEEILKAALTWEACRLMKSVDSMSAAKLVIQTLTKTRGKNLAGIITVDLRGRVGFAKNTAMLGFAYFDPATDKMVVRV